MANLKISELTAITTPASVDVFPIVDDSAVETKKITFGNLEAALSVANLSGYDANENIDHTAVTLTAGIGLTGGGTIAASRTFDLAINGLVADTIAAADDLVFYDASGVEHNKITFSSFESTLSHDNLADFVANEHIDWTAASSAFSTSGTAATGTLTVTGNIIVTGTADGRDLATDGTKLDGIEALADVTDETNVVASLDGATLTAVTVAGTDKVLVQDASDADNIKTVTAQSIADLASITTSFLTLTDTPSSFVGQALKQIRVNAGATAVEFFTSSATDELIKITASDTTAGYLSDKIVLSAGSNTTNILESSVLTPAGNEDFQIQIDESKIDHDALLNFVANEHIDHTSVTLTAGIGLTGGGDISSNRTFDMDITGLSAPTGADALTDEMAVYNQADGGVRKITLSELQTLIDTDTDTGILNVVEDTTPQLGGDLDLNGFNIDFPSTPNISDVLDEDTMSSDSATALATQQSIKAYVDSQVASVDTFLELSDTPGSYTANAVIKTNAAGTALESSGVTINASDEIAGATNLTVDNLNLNGNVVTTLSGSVEIKAGDSSPDIIVGDGASAHIKFDDSVDSSISSGTNGLDFTVDTIATDASWDFYTADADGTDDNYIKIFRDDDGGTNNSFFNIGWNQSAGYYTFLSNLTGTGSHYPVHVESDSAKLELNNTSGNAIFHGGNATIEQSGKGVFTDLDVDNVNINANTIISTDTNGDLNLDANGTGKITLQSALAINSQNVEFATATLDDFINDSTLATATATSAASSSSIKTYVDNYFPTSTDEAIARFDGTSGTLQDSGITINDTNEMSGAARITVDNLDIDGNIVSALSGNLQLDVASATDLIILSTGKVSHTTTQTISSSAGLALQNFHRTVLNGAANITGTLPIAHYQLGAWDSTNTLTASGIPFSDYAAVFGGGGVDNSGKVGKMSGYVSSMDNNATAACDEFHGFVSLCDGDVNTLGGTLDTWYAFYCPAGGAANITTTKKAFYNADSTLACDFAGTFNVDGAVTFGTSLDIGSSIAVTGVLDEDTMSSDSAVKLATQQSIKAYVDNNASDMDKATDVFKTQYIDAAAMKPSTTAGAAVVDNESTTNKINYDSLAFDAATDESAWFKAVLPEAWDGTNIKAKFHWSATGGSGDVIWGIQTLSVGNDDAIDAAPATAATVTDTLLAAGDIHTSAATADLTMTGHAAGDMVFFKVYRDADAGGDTIAQDVELLGVSIQTGEANDGAEW